MWHTRVHVYRYAITLAYVWGGEEGWKYVKYVDDRTTDHDIDIAIAASAPVS